MAPSKSTYFLCGQIFSTLYCTHNKQYSGNCSLPLWNLAKLATRNGWILEVDFLFSRIKDFPRPMSNISYYVGFFIYDKTRSMDFHRFLMILSIAIILMIIAIISIIIVMLVNILIINISTISFIHICNVNDTNNNN